MTTTTADPGSADSPFATTEKNLVNVGDVPLRIVARILLVITLALTGLGTPSLGRRCSRAFCLLARTAMAPFDPRGAGR